MNIESNNLKLVNIDTEYIAHLHKHCSEVFYRPDNYSSKPYIGILLNAHGMKYVIPLTSAKEKHKNWNNRYLDRMLIYEMIPIARKGKLSSKSIIVDNGDEKIKLIMSVIDIKKMIPVRDEVITIVDINHNDNDSVLQQKYKDLLNKELRFCISAKEDILSRAEHIYNKQMETGKVMKFGCNFKVLEEACECWICK